MFQAQTLPAESLFGTGGSIGFRPKTISSLDLDQTTKHETFEDFRFLWAWSNLNHCINLMKIQKHLLNNINIKNMYDDQWSSSGSNRKYTYNIIIIWMCAYEELNHKPKMDAIKIITKKKQIKSNNKKMDTKTIYLCGFITIFLLHMCITIFGFLCATGFSGFSGIFLWFNRISSGLFGI